MKKISLFFGVLLAVFSALGQNGHRFIAAGSGMKSIVIINEKGEKEWSHKVEGECNDVSMLSNGNILYSHKTGAKLINKDHEILWSYTGEKGTEVQSASPLSAKKFLIMQNGTPAKLMEFHISGKKLKEIEIPTKTDHPHGQFRNIRKLKNGHYLIGYFKGDIAVEYSSKGKELKRWNAKGNNFSSVRLKNGNTLVSCGDAHQLLELNDAGETVWSLKNGDLKDHPLRFVANVQVLDNGNFLICNWGGHGHKNAQAQLIEVTRDKKVVWSFCNWDIAKTISSVQALDQKGKMEKGQIVR
ncbi:hypothetical protein EMN47_13525 [Prolixibacteraceae bacterium JC049]|nr:hypothetical protein [Prolixibacteraceae bacterium JC049]